MTFLERAALTAQENAGRAHKDLCDARMAKAPADVIDTLEGFYKAAEKIQLDAYYAWRAAQ